MQEVIVTTVEQSGPSRRSRNLEERLMVRFSGAYQALAALVRRLLSPRSRLRRAFLRRQQVSAYAAASRRDFELMLVRYAGDVEIEFEPDLEPLGLSGTHRGHDGFVRMMETFNQAWDWPEVVPAMMLDMGDRVLGLGRFRLRGAASGVELEREFAQLITLRRGLVAHEREFLSWDKGLRAAGLDPDSIALPDRP